MAARDPRGYCFPDISDMDGAARGATPGFRRVAPGGEPGRVCGRAGRRREQARVDLEQEFYCKGFADGERSGLEQGERTGTENTLRQVDTLLEGLGRTADQMQRLHHVPGVHQFENHVARHMVAPRHTLEEFSALERHEFRAGVQGDRRILLDAPDQVTRHAIGQPRRPDEHVHALRRARDDRGRLPRRSRSPTRRRAHRRGAIGFAGERRRQGQVTASDTFR